MSSSGRCAFFRLMVKRVINQRQAHKPPTMTKYILDLDAVKIRLFDKVVPKTCHNFSELCTHNQGFGYTGTVFSNIVRGFGIYGGDVVERKQALQPHDDNNVGLEWNGTVIPHGKPHYLPMPQPNTGLCGRSVYGSPMKELVYEDETYFPDENHDISHDRPGIVTMATHAPHTNTSRFVILTAPAKYLDDRNVAFGEVIEGLEMLQEIDEMLGSQCGVPRHLVEIVQCGLLTHEEDALPAKISLQDMNTPRKEDTDAWRNETVYLE